MVAHYGVQDRRNARHEDNQLFQPLASLIQFHPSLFSEKHVETDLTLMVP